MPLIRTLVAVLPEILRFAQDEFENVDSTQRDRSNDRRRGDPPPSAGKSAREDNAVVPCRNADAGKEQIDLHGTSVASVDGDAQLRRQLFRRSEKRLP